MKSNTDTKKLKLKKPIMVGDTVIDELEFRDLVANDLRGMDLGKMTTDDILRLIRNSAGQPDAVVNKLSIADFTAASEIIANFIGYSRQSGES